VDAAFPASTHALGVAASRPSPPSIGLPNTDQLPPAIGQVDPESVGIMVGFPVPPDKRVTNATWPANPLTIRWTMQQGYRIFPTSPIWKSDNSSVKLKQDNAHSNLDDWQFELLTDDQITLADYLNITGAHAFLVLHRGRIAYEGYFAGHERHELHLINSVTKSLVSLLIGIYADEGLIDVGGQVKDYISDLDGSAGLFRYDNVNTETLVWILERLTGMRFSDLLSERIW
jgi:CubicO group peptidase (beta-lactamase class C family)